MSRSHERWQRETYGWLPTPDTFERRAAESEEWDDSRAWDASRDWDLDPDASRDDYPARASWPRQSRREESWHTTHHSVYREVGTWESERVPTPRHYRAPSEESEVIPRAARRTDDPWERRWALARSQSTLSPSSEDSDPKETKGRKPRFSPLTVIIILSLVLACGGSSLILGVSGFQEYTQLKALGNDGVQHLLAIKSLASATGKGLGLQDKAKAILQPAILTQMQGDAAAALSDFQRLDSALVQRQGALAIVAFLPHYGSELDSVTHLANIGLAIAQIVQEVTANAGQLAPIFATSLFAPTGPPIITPKIFDLLKMLLGDTQSALQSVQHDVAALNLGDLPLAGSQRSELAGVVTQFPTILGTATGLVKNLGMFRWVLGVDAPRHFLVQTMDRAELRPGGGFTGQFGQLSVTGGRAGSIELTDVTTLDDYFKGHHPPPIYQSWWPFGSFGLRESNLSGDYPTSAKLALSYYHTESGATADGDISFSVVVIAHLLDPTVVGPITLPCYNVTITAQNLEEKIHYYQLGAGVATDYACTHGSGGSTTVRKSFTAALAAALQAQIRTLPSDKLGNLVHSISADFAAKNIEVYFADSASEAQLSADGQAAEMLRSGSADSTYIVQANIGANKGSIYVATHETETITLNDAGDAQHTLKVTMAYRPTGDIYSFGLTSMRDYIRVYVPANAHYVGGSGFDETTSDPLCYYACTPKQAPICDKTADNPTGAFLPSRYAPTQPRTEGSGIDDDTGATHTDDIGEPTNFTSDEPGRAMMAGLVVIPVFCTATWSLQWTVPHAAGNSAAHNLPYTFIEQHQSGTGPDLTVQITPATGAKTPAIADHLASQQTDQTWMLHR